MLEIKKIHIIGIVAAVITIAIDILLLRGQKIFYFVLGIGFIIGALPFMILIFIETERERDKDEMFLEFSRNLVESVKAGTPISRSILNIKGKDYGSLTPHIDKLSNQISLGIPVKEALENLAADVNSKVISRAVTLISEAEHAGGEIESILEAVAASVSQTEKLKKERKAAVYTLVVQGYIIFLMFIIIMLVMQFKILPMTAGFSLDEGTDTSDLGELGVGFSPGKGMKPEEMAAPFLYLLLVQGFFAGLTIGKLSEGNLKSGLKHSFILVVTAWLISTGVNAFLG